MVTFVRLVLACDKLAMRRSKVYRIMVGSIDGLWLTMGIDRALSTLEVDTIVIIVCCHRMLSVGQDARPTSDSKLNQPNSIVKANTNAKCNTFR
jgi:hypothetical protein